MSCITKYKDYRIGYFLVDVLVDNRLLIELKATPTLRPIHEAQLLAYLHVSNLSLGILVNFGGQNIIFKRFANTVEKPSYEETGKLNTPISDNFPYPELRTDLIAVLNEVRQHIKPGFMHMHYRRATQFELRLHGIPFELKKKIIIMFHQQPLQEKETRLLIVDDKVILTPVAVRGITFAMKNRLRYYLNLLGLEVGIIANFHTPHLEIETVTKYDRIQPKMTL